MAWWVWLGCAGVRIQTISLFLRHLLGGGVLGDVRAGHASEACKS